ncbi:unnamed protein product [Linum tenue]|uniref:Uncharacterized protein n=1 Tax=Linum tenue TaxID=586396 RepID=A0AAV0I4S3_9ROSI|nr:unnamed protein product [Linum tenue]CAI0392694.1 unnamed protein product [Linum tenue]
MRLLACVFL